MTWSRIDSGFWRHPKFTGWTAAQKWALGELIGYCCEFKTDGHVPDDLSLLPRSITKGFLLRAVDAGWIDVDDDGGLCFHDWNDYHPSDPTAADRMKRHRRNKKRNGAVTNPVTTNTSTKTKEQRPLTLTVRSDDERTDRGTQEDPDGPNERTGEGHGSHQHPVHPEPARHDPADLQVRSVVQAQFGAR